MRQKAIDLGSLRILYLPVNQAWALCWFSHVLRIFNTRAEAIDEARYILDTPAKR